MGGWSSPSSCWDLCTSRARDTLCHPGSWRHCLRPLCAPSRLCRRAPGAGQRVVPLPGNLSLEGETGGCGKVELEVRAAFAIISFCASALHPCTAQAWLTTPTTWRSAGRSTGRTSSPKQPPRPSIAGVEAPAGCDLIILGGGCHRVPGLSILCTARGGRAKVVGRGVEGRGAGGGLLRGGAFHSMHRQGGERR